MNKLLLFTIAVLFIQLSCAREDKNRGYKVKIGEQVPAFSLDLLDGTTISTKSLKGKVVVFQFTASWCGVCRKEMPHLESEVWQQFKDDNFILIGIDLKETPEKVKDFIEETGISYPVGIDADGSIFGAFTVPGAGVTRNIVLDRSGKIIFLTRLYEREEFEQMIEVIKKELQKTE